MSLAGIDDAFELGVRQHAVSDEVRRQVRPIGRLRRRNRGHRRRLHEPGRMRLRAGNTDRLQSVFFIKRIREAGALRRRPVDSLIGELHGLRFGERRDRRTAKRSARDSRERSAALREDGGRRGERGEARRGGTCSLTQASSVAASGATRRGRKDLRVGSGLLVDDGEPRVDRGAVLRIDRAVDSGGEDDAAALLQPDESVAPGRIVRGEVGAGDCDETAALGRAAPARKRHGDSAASAMRRSTFAIAEKGGFITTTLGVIAASR